MRVSLLYPGIIGKGWASIGQGMDSGWISHGLAILSACAQRAGHEVDLLDLRAARLGAFAREVDHSAAAGRGRHHHERGL
jgi:hypothetical protein